MPQRLRCLLAPGLITLVLVAALVDVAPSARAAEASARDCAVRMVEGDGGRVWAGGVWLALVPGPVPQPDPKIVTDQHTRAEIACTDGTVVTIAPGTEVNLETLLGPAGPASNVVVQMIEGLIGIVAPRGGFARFDVRTPLAIASVRSTEWAVQHGADGSAVFVRTGAVEVTAAAGRAQLGPGDGVDIAAGAAPAPGPVRQWGAARVETLRAALGFGWR